MLLVAVLIWSGSTACGRAAPDSAPSQQAAAGTHEASAEAQPIDRAADGLLGDWELQSEPPQRMPGIQLTVTVDSVSSTHYFGRLSHYFSGDVGVDPREFQPFADSIRPNGSVLIAIAATDHEMLGMVLDGVITADTIRLSLFVLGPDTLSNSNRRWALVKRR